MTTPTTTDLGQATADKLVGDVNAGNVPPYLTLVHTCAQLPAAFATLAQDIQQNAGTSVADLLYAAVRPHATLRQQFQMTNPASDAPQQQRRFRDMADGTGEYALDLTTLQIDGFMTGMFTGITAGHPATKFTERDLFHGHILPNEANRDVVIVFHAKEYPDQIVSSFRDGWEQTLNLNTTGRSTFAVSDQVMFERNFIWTLRTNKIFLITGAPGSSSPHNDFKALMYEDGAFPTDPTKAECKTVQERNFGRLMLSVNYFPTLLSSQPLFFTPLGGWGVLVKLEAEFPHIPKAVIAKTYADEKESLKTTTTVLLAWKPTT